MTRTATHEYTVQSETSAEHEETKAFMAQRFPESQATEPWPQGWTWVADDVALTVTLTNTETPWNPPDP